MSNNDKNGNFINFLLVIEIDICISISKRQINKCNQLGCFGLVFFFFFFEKGLGFF